MALLRSGWRVDTRSGRYRVVSGWVVVMLALILLGSIVGTVIGLTIATLVFGLCGYCAVVLNSERRQVRATRGRKVSQDDEQGRGSGWGRGGAAFLLAMLAAIASGSAIAGLPIGPAVDRVTIGGIVLPVIWAAFIVWVLSETRLRRAVLGLCRVIGVSAILIAIEVLA